MTEARSRFLSVITLSILLVFVATAANGEMMPARLFCEYASNPLGVDTPRPRFGWSFESGTKRGERQTAYQVLVASSEEDLKSGRADLWDSGKVVSDDNIQVAYGGKPLPSDTTCYWKVRVWDQHGHGGTCSNLAHFDTGLRTPANWKNAAWIAWRPEAQWAKDWDIRRAKQKAAPVDPNAGWVYPKEYPKQADFSIFKMYRFHEKPYDPAPLFRKDFTLDKPIKRARAYICGLGYYELHLNGQKVGDHLLDPARMDPFHHVCYVTYDVTDQLRQGANAIGVILGRGFTGLLVDDVWRMNEDSQQPKLILRLSVDYVDGTKTDIISRPDWKVTGGPIVFDDPFRGELYDAGKEIPGWDQPGTSDIAWDTAVPAPAPGGQLTGYLLPPIRAVDEIHPVSVTNPKPGVYVFNMGKNISGWPRLKISGPAGTEILCSYSDRNKPKTSLPDPSSYGSSYRQHGFVLGGKGIETLEPRFSYTTFQYVVVSGAPTPLTVNDLTGIHVHSDLPSIGEFECSNPLLNDIHRATRLTLVDHLHGLLTDSTREQRPCFEFDGLNCVEPLQLNFDMAAYYKKRLLDLADCQYANGMLPENAPNARHFTNNNFSESEASALGMLWNEYVYHGDRRILEEHYELAKRAIDGLGKNQRGAARVTAISDTDPGTPAPYITSDLFGDFGSIDDGQPFTIKGWKSGSSDKEGKAIYGTAWYYYAVATLVKIANVLGKSEDTATYTVLAKNIQDAFDKNFYDPEKKCYRGEIRDITEYRQSADAVPLYYGLVPKERQPAIVSNLVASLAERKDRLNTGWIGATAIMEVLPEFGAGENAYRLASQTESFSWGWMVHRGYSVFEENWGGAGPHPMLCSIGAYFYRWLAGIQADPEHPGFRHFFIRPTFVTDLNSVRATYRCPSGLIENRWQRHDGRLTLEAVVPPNTTATITMPAADAGVVNESGRPAAQAQGVKLVRAGDGAAVFEVQSGSYRFEMNGERH